MVYGGQLEEDVEDVKGNVIIVLRHERGDISVVLPDLIGRNNIIKNLG